MASAAKPVKAAPAIEHELKEFLDEVLIPMLVRDALKDLASETPSVAHSTSISLRSAEEIV